ncbi:neprilysin-1-like [Haematobia irritans]|uniref:neprilysin-1-like n=1 Tax=Haematobia irritans TaxID=7368 RepID=UPI003F501C8A
MSECSESVFIENCPPPHHHYYYYGSKDDGGDADGDDDDGNDDYYSEKEIRLSKSEEIQKYLNESIDPCEDFYEFACGNWKHFHEADEGQMQKNVLMEMNTIFDFKLKAMMEDIEFKALDTNEEKVVKFYRSCLNKAADSESYREHLRAIIEEFGKMPLLKNDEEWQEQDFDWLTTVAHIAYKYSHNIMMGFYVVPYPKNVSIHGLVIGHQKFAFPLPLYPNNSEGNYWSRYEKKMEENLMEYFDVNSTLAKETAHDLVLFEKNLAKGATQDRYGPYEYRNEISVDRMQGKYFPHMDIEKYVKIAFGSIPQDFVLEENEGYHYNLIEVVARTPKRIIANYVFYSLVHHFAAKDRNCLEETKFHFNDLVENMWYRRNSVEEMETAVKNIFEDLKSVLFIWMRTKKYKWMSSRVLRYSLEKLNALSLHIYSYNETNFDEEYGPLELNNSDYLRNLQEIYSLQALKKRKKFYELTQNYYDPENMPQSIKYIRQENRIVIPLALLQPHQFRSSLYPLAVNYGQLGSQLAHAIIHAFDDEARFFDKYGNEVDWWDHRSSVFFKDHYDCFRDQYQHFHFSDSAWPDSVVQSENIADNGGIRLAYATYMAWYENTLRTHLV